MLNYTTTTIVNSADTFEVKDTKGGWKFVVAYGPELTSDSSHTVRIIGKQEYKAAVKAKATIASLPTDSGVYRIAMYIRLRNNNNPYFSNEWTFKGKPLYIEFNGGTSADDLVSLIKKHMLVQYGYNLVDVKVSGAGIEIVAHDQWEMFLDQDNNAGVIVEKLQTVDMAGNIIAAGASANSPTHEEFVEETSVTITIDNGNEAFGDFAHIVKDLRLPTAANLRWQGIAQGDVFGDEPNDDKPLPTGKYTQITVQYDAERGIGQQTVLGGVGTSRTVHVFYVESAVATDFFTALSGMDGVKDCTTIEKPA